jgi:uncharacterized ubiquitin-like protein YukD
MKTKKNYFSLSVVLVLILLLSISCIKGLGENGENFVEINDFYIEILTDTVPCEINVIYNMTVSGRNKLYFIHQEAERCSTSFKFIQNDTTFREITILKKSIKTITDTLQLCYKDAGKHLIKLEVNGQVYSDEITLYETE